MIKAAIKKGLYCSLFFLTLLDARIEEYFKKVENKEGNHSMPGIDFIYMVNLDKRPEKYENTMKQFRPFGIVPFRFSAVNGWELPPDAFLHLGVKVSESKKLGIQATAFRLIDGKEVWHHEMMTDPHATYYSHCMPKGSIGCVLSHLSVLQDAYDAGYHTVWVMEDDVLLACDPRILSEVVASLDRKVPKWDILYTDTDTINNRGERVPCRAVAQRPNFLSPPLATYLKKIYKIDEEFSSTGMRYGTYSYLIRRSGMKKILDFWKKHHIFLPIDIDLCFVPKLRMICTNENLVSTTLFAPSDNGIKGYCD